MPDTILSLNGAAKHVGDINGRLLHYPCSNFVQMLQPLYTMNGFNWFDKRGVEGVGFVRTLRTLLTNDLPKLLPDLRVLTNNHWDRSIRDKMIESGTLITVPLRRIAC